MSFAYSPSTSSSSSSVAAPNVLVSVSRALTNQTGLTGDGTANAISFDTVLSDVYGFWSAGAPTRLTVPTGMGGLYRATITQRYDVSSPSSWMSISVRKNGSTVPIEAFEYIDSLVQSNMYIAKSAVFTLVDGDYIEEVAAFAGGAARTAVGGLTRSNLTLERLGD